MDAYYEPYNAIARILRDHPKRPEVMELVVSFGKEWHENETLKAFDQSGTIMFEKPVKRAKEVALDAALKLWGEIKPDDDQDKFIGLCNKINDWLTT